MDEIRSLHECRLKDWMRMSFILGELMQQGQRRHHP